MFSVSLEGLPVAFCNDWNERYQVFQSRKTVLPSWVVRFYCCIPNESELSAYKLGEVNAYRFYKGPQHYWIYAYAGRQLAAARLTDSFDEVNVYSKNYIDIENSINDIQNLLCQAYRYRALNNEGLLFHSSAISYKGAGVVFIGHSGAGKSTQAELWNRYMGAEILNYDQNYVARYRDGFRVSSTPWGGKERYYINKVVDLKALVFVQKSLGENRIERLGKANGFSTIYLHNYMFPFDCALEDKLSNSIGQLVAKVPVYKLYCTRDEKAVDVLYKELSGLSTIG